MKKIVFVLITILILFSSSTYADNLTFYRNDYIEGYLKDVTQNKIRLEQYEGKVYDLPLTKDTVFLIDNRFVVYSDFKPGMEVFAKLKNRSIVRLEGYSTQNPGYIPPGGKVRSGLVKKIDRNQLVIKLATGQEKTFYTSPATLVLKNGRNVDLTALYEGDRVKLYFDEVESNTISRMEIQGDSILVKGLYKGKVSFYDKLTNTIVIQDMKVLRNGDWSYVKSAYRIPYSTDYPLYMGNSRIPFRYLKYLRGKTVYMAVKSIFGRDKIAKMVVKNSNENTYSEKIEKVNWYTQTIELSNKKNIEFYDGTIIIKNGRLVDKYSLTPKSDAFIVSDGISTSRVADVIYVYNENINNSNIGQNYLYCGELEKIVQDVVLMNDFFILNKNEWEAFEDEKELYYDNDTYLYDLEEDRQITPRQFFAEDYSVDEDSEYAEDHNLSDWYGYLFTEGERIVAAAVKKDMDSLLGQRVTNGTVKTVEEDSVVGWTLSLRDAKDWSSRKQMWKLKKTSIRVNLTEALIIKQNQVISPSTLKPGDRLYIVRDGFTGKVVIVK